MSWKERLRELLLAGGTMASIGALGTGCCGNAISDPCICGRPQQSKELKAACDQKTQCLQDGGEWNDEGAWMCVLPKDAGRDQAGADRAADAPTDAGDGG